MQCPTFSNIYWDLNIRKLCRQRGPLNLGTPYHGITGISSVNPVMAIRRLVKKARENAHWNFESSITLRRYRNAVIDKKSLVAQAG